MSGTQGRAGAMEEICRAAGVSDMNYASFVLSTAPKAQKVLSKAFKQYIAKQARLLVGSSVSLQSMSDPLTRSSRNKDEGVYSSKFTQQMDDLMLAGMEGLMRAAYRFQEVNAGGRGAGKRFSHGPSTGHMKVTITDRQGSYEATEEQGSHNGQVSKDMPFTKAALRSEEKGTASDLSDKDDPRLVTFANFYIRKYIMAAIKEASFNQVSRSV
jgi:hypothetical protein